MSPSRDVHLAPDETGAALVRGFIGHEGTVLAATDCLSCGPLDPAFGPEWVARRLDFWREVQGEDHLPTASLLPSVSTLQEAEVLTLWLGACLDDQLMLASVPSLLKSIQAEPRRVEVVQFTLDFTPRRPFPSIFLLKPEEIRHHPAPVALNDADFKHLERVWACCTSPTPSDLAALLEHDTSSGFPVLFRALAQVPFRFPDIKIGLSRWDYYLLSVVRDRGPRVVRVIAHILGSSLRELDSVGDIWLYWRLKRLANRSLPFPLVNLSMDADPFTFASATVALTSAGAAVLDGTTSAALMNGLDDWVGGVHLQSEHNRIWYSEEGRIVASP
jgi:hypothetical protein